MSEQCLINAIKNNNLVEAKRLIASGLSTKCTDECGRTPLHFAKSDEMRDYLRDVDPAAYSVWEREQDLIDACDEGDLDEAKRLVDSGVSVNCRNWLGWTTYDCAASDEISDFLCNVDPAAYSAWAKQQDLIRACESGDLDEAKHLVDSGVSVKCRNWFGFTPLHIAVARGSNMFAAWLLTSGASIACIDEEGKTPLHCAASYDQKEVAVCLLRSGASLTLKDECERTPLHFAKSNEMRDFLRDLDPAAYSVWEKEQELIKACARGHLNKAKRLVQSGVSVRCRDWEGKTSLHCAASEGHEEVAEWLLNSGASVTDKDQFEHTALMSALQSGNEDIAQLLLDRGSALSLQEAVIALEHAREEEHDEIVSLVMKQLKWLSRRSFLMFLATQSYLPPAPHPLADSMSRDELDAYYQQFHHPETRPLSSPVHSVFFLDELRRYIASFIGSE